MVWEGRRRLRRLEVLAWRGWRKEQVKDVIRGKDTGAIECNVKNGRGLICTEINGE